ncbi:SDR family oxidoreductase [Gorillibacterium timonense]|uniref:SDR family oxidoreductase n=1 Tax=Gorillibacterium timonense TaxID=1689269 RepID=UPI00071D8B42|nr:SDR family oxidoreductase [Gorillibacterium timonense]
MKARKVALITGSARGLGKRTALTLAAGGCDIGLNYRHSAEEAQQLRREIEETYGVRCVAVQADICRPDDLSRLAEETVRQLGDIDILVNNAGPFIHERRLFADYSPEEIRYLLSGNLGSVIELDALVLPAMRRNGWGRIIHFGFGRAAESPAWVHRAVYAAAKVGLVSFTKTLAVEEARNGITVNMICPGDIKGDNKEKLIREAELLRDELSPRGRPGSGEDVARVIAFLCQQESDFITGNIFDVSGGLDPIRSLSGGMQRRAD